MTSKQLQGFSEYSYVLTKRGTVDITNVRSDDEVTTDGKSWHKVLKVHHDHYKGEMISIETPDTNILCTPDQVLYTDRSDERRKGLMRYTAKTMMLGEQLPTCTRDFDPVMIGDHFAVGTQRVIKIAYMEYSGDIYALDVEGFLYAVNNIIVE